jgi:hypothetical protein
MNMDIDACVIRNNCSSGKSEMITLEVGEDTNCVSLTSLPADQSAKQSLKMVLKIQSSLLNTDSRGFKTNDLQNFQKTPIKFGKIFSTKTDMIQHGRQLSGNEIIDGTDGT